MSKVSNKQAVLMTYSIVDADGEVLEQSDIPVGYVHGVPNQMFPKVEKALHGCEVGETVSVLLTPQEGFGEYDASLTFSDNIENVPPEFQKIGAEAEFVNESGGKMTMTVRSVEDGMVNLDGNHLFAGKTVTFNVKVNEIRSATAEELATGTVASALTSGMNG